MLKNNISGPYPLTYTPSPVTITLIDAHIPAGFPSPCTDYTEESLDLNTYIVRNQAATFYFSVKGYSMSGAGILDGDKVAVDRSIPPRHGHIVVAVVDDEYTLKRLYRQGLVIELQSEHPAFPPMRMKDGQELVIWGVVTAVIRKLSM